MHELAPRAFTLAELVVGFVYDLLLPEDTDGAVLDRCAAAIAAFLGAERFTVTRESGGKQVVKEIRPFVAGLTLDRPGRLRL